MLQDNKFFSRLEEKFLVDATKKFSQPKNLFARIEGFSRFNRMGVSMCEVKFILRNKLLPDRHISKYFFLVAAGKSSPKDYAQRGSIFSSILDRDFSFHSTEN